MLMQMPDLGMSHRQATKQCPQVVVYENWSLPIHAWNRNNMNKYLCVSLGMQIELTLFRKLSGIHCKKHKDERGIPKTI